MIFDGNPRRSRKINLGGNRQNSSRTDVLKNAELQRMKREQSRKELLAAATLQSVWRIRQSTRRALHDLSQQFVSGNGFDLPLDSIRAAFALFLPSYVPMDSWSTAQTISGLLSHLLELERQNTTSRQDLNSGSTLALSLSSVLCADGTDINCSRLVLQLLILESIRPELVPALTTSLLTKIDKRTCQLSSTELFPYFQRLCTINPVGFVRALILAEPHTIAWIDGELLRPAFSPDGLASQDLSGSFGLLDQSDQSYQSETPMFPENCDAERKLALISILAPISKDSWPLISSILENMGVCPRSLRRIFDPQVLYSPQLVHHLADRSDWCLEKAVKVSQYLLRLLAVFPYCRNEILLQFSLISSPSLIQLFWAAFKECGGLYALCLQGSSELSMYHGVLLLTEHANSLSLLTAMARIYSYWLQVATDEDFLHDTRRTLDFESLRELSVVLRNLCFTMVWHWERVSRYYAIGYILFVLMRQIHHRDIRRKVLPPDFWLMEDQMTELLQWLGISKGTESIEPFVANYVEEYEDDDVYRESDGEEDHDDDSDAESLAFRDRRIKVRTESRPIEVLRHMPYFASFATRVNLFRSFVARDRELYPDSAHLQLGQFGQFGNFGRQHFPINRETLLEDAQSAFAVLGSRLKNQLAVQFLSAGIPEPGIDGGGLTKETLTSICSQIFTGDENGDFGDLFVETADHFLYPNPKYGERDDSMTVDQWAEIRKRYIFVGQTIGKCLYENILLDVSFAPFFMAKWAGDSATRSSFDDLYLMDRALYNSLLQVYHYDQVEDLALDFTTIGSQGQTILLRQGGNQIPVTNSNKVEYIRQLAHYKLNVSLGQQTKWFLEGMSTVVLLNWLRMFNPFEIQCLISGDSQDFDVEDLRENTQITGFAPNSPTISNLWTVLKNEFTSEQRCEFLKFVTSVPKAPLLGFRQLQPSFGIRCVGHDDLRLPTSSTCVNLLKLPEYSSLDLLRQKLVYAIESKAGFDLS